jgi:hypothetical protein
MQSGAYTQAKSLEFLIDKNTILKLDGLFFRASLLRRNVEAIRYIHLASKEVLNRK